mmetsp:Transcript_31120/g.89273  ORF Transcript_31120/g.89273 Transcript_31120/m.89273 type:complete len:201 (+) Transcript_31120:101-703(+)
MRLILAWLVLLSSLTAASRDGDDSYALSTDARGYLFRVRAAAKRVGGAAQDAAQGAAESIGAAAHAAVSHVALGAAVRPGGEARNFSSPTDEKLLEALGEQNVGDLSTGACPKFTRDNYAYGCKLGCRCNSLLQRCFEGYGSCGVLQVAQSVGGTVNQDCLDTFLGQCSVPVNIVCGIIAGVVLLVLIPAMLVMYRKRRR